jgi:hypothetical protein
MPADEAPRLGAVVLLGALAAACVSRPTTDTASGEESSGGETGGAGTTSGVSTTSSGTSTSPTSSATGTAMSTGEQTSSNDVDGNDAGCSFYGGCPVDGGFSPNECDQWVQDCPVGEKCMPFDSDGDNRWDALKCVPVAPNPGKPGEPCLVEGSDVSGIDDCELGAMCWKVDDETGTGVCAAMCTGTPDQPVCAEPGTACFDASLAVVTLCLPSCDPVLPDCPDGETCIHSAQQPNNFVCFLDASGEEGQEFDPCEFTNVCDPGLLCANPALATECDPDAWGCCLAWCDLTMPACNAEGAECLAWFEEGQGPPELQHVGVCGIPQ